MTYQPKVIRCRLHTGGKTIQKIRERYAGQGMTYRDFENIQRANEEFDGLVVLLSLWDYDNHEAYHLHNWDPADDERMMMAIYHSEQVHPFPRYKNALEQFKADWAAGTYDPGGGNRSSLRRDRAGAADGHTPAPDTQKEAQEAPQEVRKPEWENNRK